MSKKAIYSVIPTKDWYVIKRFNIEEKTEGGIILPDQAKKLLPIGEVLARGPGRYSEFDHKICPMSAQVGNVVVFSQAAGHKVDFPGVGSCWLVNEVDIIAIIGEADEQKD